MYSGKALYQPKGKAGEYSAWAVNFYNGCSNGCEYCYLRRGVLSHVMGSGKPALKNCFKDENDAFATFVREVMKNRDAIRRDGGLLFSFSTDPCLPETVNLTMTAVAFATGADVPCKILTKCTDWMFRKEKDGTRPCFDALVSYRKNVAVGFTVTGFDELEPGASPTAERLRAMSELHAAGVRTFASMEPVIDVERSFNIMSGMTGICDHFKVGLQSGKQYTPEELARIAPAADELLRKGKGFTVYFKRSIRPFLHPETLLDEKCVGADFDIFAPA